LFGGPEELVQAMRRLQHEPGLRQRMARIAYEGFEKYWSETAVMPQYLRVVRNAALAKGRTDVVKRLQSEEVVA
jgi:hypothetical protein